jgi:extradiol dioxygenase family protein
MYPVNVKPMIRDLKAYVPAKDFELSKRFYSSLGFTMSEGWGGTADFELGGSRFRLQDYYVTEWANNFMMVMGVDDVDAWHRLASEVARDPDFKTARVAEIEEVGDSRVLHVVDPSGVLLIFVQ